MIRNVGGNGQGQGAAGSAHTSGRRNIRDIMSYHELSKDTKKSRAAERKRLVSLYGKVKDKKDYLTLFQDDFSTFGWQQQYLCLNPTLEGEIPQGSVGEWKYPAFVHEGIAKALKPHQIAGARFMWGHVSLENGGFGCVLADFMGLGKTLQVIAVVHTFLKVQHIDAGVASQKWKTVLIAAPAICVRNWEAEFKKWLPHEEVRDMGLYVLEASKAKTVKERVAIIRKWKQRGGVLLMGYEMYRVLVQGPKKDNTLNPSAKQKANMELLLEASDYLCQPGPDMVVLDEAHRLRNGESQLVKAFANVSTARRILLTGYPLQNHLMEYWTMVNYARDAYLGTHAEFKNQFGDPISNGQFTNSTEDDIYLTRKSSFLLIELLKHLVLRRGQEYLVKALPPKREWILMCKLSNLQSKLYYAFLQYLKKYTEQEMRRNKDDQKLFTVLQAFHISMGISNHPDILYQSLQRQKMVEEKKSMQVLEAGNESDEAFEAMCVETESKQKHLVAKIQNANEEVPSAPLLVNGEDSDSDIECVGVVSFTSGSSSLSFADPVLKDHVLGIMKNSAKMVVLFDILHECVLLGDRVTIFSQSLTTLDIISELIYEHNEAIYAKNLSPKETQKETQYRFLRIDGSVAQIERFRLIQEFNDPESDVDFMLVSTKAGGEGVNLIGGNRVVIFDVCWNPSHDHQAMCRSYRFGQTKPVHIYRLISGATLERTVYNKQVRKEGVSKRVVDDTPLGRKFAKEEMSQYFSVERFEEVQNQFIVDENVPDCGDEEILPSPPSPHHSEDEEDVDVLIDEKMNIVDDIEGKECIDGQVAENGVKRKHSCTEISDIPDTSNPVNLENEFPIPSPGIVDLVDNNLHLSPETDGEASRMDLMALLARENSHPNAARLETRRQRLESKRKPTTVRPSKPEEWDYDPSLDRGSVMKDPALSKVIRRKQKWLADYYQQGVMFDEDLSVLCTEEEQKEALNEYETRLAAKDHDEIMAAAAAAANAADYRNMPGHPNMPPMVIAPGPARPVHPNSYMARPILPTTKMPHTPLQILSQHRIMLMKRGVKDADVLQKGAEALGAKFDIELTRITTTIVSAWEKDRVLKWLKLPTFPPGVTYENEEWLRRTVARF